MIKALPTIDIRPGLSLPRLIRGTWQIHEQAGRIASDVAIADLLAGFDLGFTTIEASDSYDGVEDLLGLFRSELLNRRGGDAVKSFRVHTRVSQTGSVPLGPADIKARVQRSCQRLGQVRLDLVQLQWWNLALPGWREAAQVLHDLRINGTILDIGLANFPAAEMQAILADGVELLSNQVQISLLDPRAGNGVMAACREHRMQVFGYAPLAGGFLSEAWLGAADPGLEPKPEKPFGRVYRQLIEHFGGWGWLQSLLETLKACALRHDTDIPAIALAWSLQRSGANALLVGMSSPDRARAYIKAAQLALADADITAIDLVLAERGPVAGEVAAVERAEMQSAIAASYTAAP